MSQGARAEWLEATTKHFIITGDTSEIELRRRAQRLEQFDAAMRYLVGGVEGVRVRLYLLNSMSELQTLAGSQSVGGFYGASAQEARAFMPLKIAYSRPGFTAESVLFHEYTHHMLLGSTTSYAPRWATEGLAEMFMTARINEDGSVTLGAPNPSRSDSIVALHHWTVEEMLRKDSVKVPDDEMIERYSRGWALCHYLWMSGKRPGQYVEFIRLLNESGDQVKAAKQAFGDLAKLNSEVEVYLRQRSMRTALLTAEQIKAPAEVAIRRMSDGEATMIPKRMVSARGVDKKQAALLYAQARPVALAHPGDAMVQTWFAEIAFDADQLAEADVAADRALAADPQRVAAMAFKGLVAARKALQSRQAADWKLARSWFLRGNKADPNNPWPFALYYDSFGAAGEKPTANAQNGLFRAVMVMPQDMDLRTRAAIELLRLGDVPKARMILAPVAFYPDRDAENPMMKLIQAIDAGQSAPELLKKAGELKLTQVNQIVPAPESEGKKDATGD